jgi:diacylglycerol kinase (ATP)
MWRIAADRRRGTGRRHTAFYASMQVLILHNPSAGEGALSGEELTGLFRAEKHHVVYADIKADGIDRGAAATADVVVVAGGDGTVGQAVRAIGDLDRSLLIVPLGTANNVAHSLGLPFSPATTAREFPSWGTRRLDLGIASGTFGRRPFLEGVGIGAIAELVDAGEAGHMDVREEKRFGEEAPPVMLQQARPQRWRAVVDGVELPDELLLIEVLNMPLVGPSLPLGAGGAPDDGLLDVAFLRPAHREPFVHWLDGDRSTQPEGLEIVRARQVSFDWRDGPLLIDDHLPDPPEGTSRVDLGLADVQLRLLAPNGKGDRR